MHKMKLVHGIGTVAACCILIFTLGSCAPLQEAVPAPGVEITAAAGDEVVAELRGEALLLNVHSESGIGSATVTLPADLAARDLILRLHLAGLEELRFDYGEDSIRVAVSSGDLIVREEARRGNEAAPRLLAPADDLWMDVGILSGRPGVEPEIPLEAGYFDVRAPRDFLRSGTRTFTVAWIDFFR